MTEIISNRYQIETELGTGGMGTVYRGIDTQTEQTIAIKQLKSQVAQPDIIERFQREGEALRKLNHPNIVKMLDMVEQDGLHYLVMEYVAGGDLQKLLKVGRIPIERCVQLALDLSDALTRAHKLNIIHRDLKPANVLIAEDDTLRLTDFGVALIGQKERVTDTNAIVGTLDYLPPEVFTDGNFDTRADVWAFGVILFEMLTGKAPFNADAYSQVIYAIINEPTPDIEDLRPDAPLALLDLIYRMLEKDPTNRIRSVRQVGLELEDILQGRATSTGIQQFSRFETPIPSVQLRPKHNLPQQATAFVGRESEIAELSRLLAEPNVRLVTIVAPGGMGKTRLSLETAERNLHHFENGVYFVELAALTNPDAIIPAIADAIGYQFHEGDNRPQKEQVLEFLAEKNLLLVTDNWEQILDGAALIVEILQIAPNLKLIATSRERLNLSGEQLFTLSGLDFPEWETPEDALEYAAVKLFMNSATRARPDFELLADELTFLGRICRLVAGMPLAIVLAAAWIESLSLEEIAEELTQDIEILESELRDIPERQRSIQAVFDYAWNRLDEAEQTVFMKLAVFKDGFNRKAAQTVTGASLRQLTNLVNKSLLQRDNTSGRYNIHELLRQYAERHLAASDEAASTYSTHMKYYADALQKRENHLKGHKQLEALKDIETDFENIRAALDWAVEQEVVDVIDQMLEGLMVFALVRTRSEEIDRLFAAAQASLEKLSRDEYRLTLARIIIRRNRLASSADALIAMEDVVKQSLEIAHEADSFLDAAIATTGLGVMRCFRGEVESGFDLLQQALTLFQQHGDKWWIAEMLQLLGFWSLFLGRIQDVYQYQQDCLALFREIGDRYGIGNILNNIAAEHTRHGRYNAAIETQYEAITVRREIGDLFGLTWSLLSIVHLLILTADFATAREFLDEAILIGSDFTTLTVKAFMKSMQSKIYLIDKDYAQALELSREALSLAERGKNYSVLSLSRTEHILHLCLLQDYENAKRNIPKQWGLASQIQHLADKIYLALAIIHILIHNEEYTRAAELYSLIDTHPAGFPEMNKKYPPTIDLVSKLKAALGEEAYQAAYEKGSQLDLETTLQAFLDEYKKDNA